MDPYQQSPSALASALEGMIINTRPIPFGAQDQTPRNIARLAHQLEGGRGTKANEYITAFVGEALATPQGRLIQKNIQVLPNKATLSIKCLNPDDSEYHKVVSEKSDMPITVGKVSPDALLTKISLSELRLPPNMVKCLSYPHQTIDTVQKWMQSKFPRVNFTKPIMAETSSFCMSLPISPRTQKADFVPQIKVGRNETWLFVIFNRSGDHYTINGMEFRHETTYQMQAGEHHQQKDWSVYPLPLEVMQNVENSRPEVAEEFKKSSLVIVGVRVEKDEPNYRIINGMRFDGLGGVSRGTPMGGPRPECTTAAADYGIIAGGESRAIHYGSSSYTGKYKLTDDAFVSFGAALPVNFTQSNHEYNLSNYIKSCDEALDNATGMMEKLAPCLTKTALRENMLAKIGQPTNLVGKVFLVKDISDELNPYIDFTNRISMANNTSNLTLNGKNIIFFQDPQHIQNMYFYNSPGKAIMEKMPTIFTYATKSNGKPSTKKVLVYDYNFHSKHYDVYIVDIATNILNLNIKRTVHLADMHLEKFQEAHTPMVT